MKNIKYYNKLSNLFNVQHLFLICLSICASIAFSKPDLGSGGKIEKILLYIPDSTAEDTVLPDTVVRIQANEIYEVGDSAMLISIGLDTILLYHTEEATNYIVEGTEREFYIGEQDTLLNLYSFIDSNSYYITIDTSYLEVDSSIVNDSMTLFITQDTIYLSSDTISYFIATDSDAYYIPQGESNVYKLISSNDTTIQEETGFDKIGITSLLDINRGQIEVYVGGSPKEVNQNLFGFTLEGAFLPGHISETDVLGASANNPEAWDWLSDLKPRTLRFPGGANGKFMHLLPYDTDGDLVNDKIPKGYGYDMNEIIEFYDQTDGFLDIGGCATCEYTYAQVKADLEDGDLDGTGGIWEVCHEWIKPIYDEDISSFYNKWDTQDELPVGEKPYIDEFIDLVDLIEDANNYKIDVILDLNILSSSATQCAEIVNYLRDETLNGVTSVNVVGVEMGNECYFKWLNELMRIDGFTEYWDYLNGVSVTLSSAVPSWVVSDHNYINTLRTGVFIANPIKIGIPAENPGEVDDDGTVVTSDWNVALGNIVEDDDENDKFDAVIIHNYFDAQKNWQNIPQDHLCLEYPNIGFPTCTGVECASATYPRWRYDIYDGRLRNAFDGFLGLEYDYPGNIGEFLKETYYTDFGLIRSQLNLGYEFPDLTTHGIEIWNTEKNLKDKLFVDADDPMTELEKQQRQNLNSIYNNSFPHGLLMQEWLLNDIKLNFKRGYGSEFLTYGHYHNYAGGGWFDMLVAADCGDFKNHIDEFGNPDPLVSSSGYYMRRTTYWTMKLLSEISRYELKYLPSHFEMGDMNPNMAPTIFYKPNNYLYFYYSNKKAVSQKYIIYPNDVEGVFGGNRDFISFSGAGIFNVKVDYNYMTSGKSTLSSDNESRSINSCYDCSVTGSHPFHIWGVQQETLDIVKEDPLLEVYTVTVPPNSFGYFKLKINWGPAEIGRLGDNSPQIESDIRIFPNPTGNKFEIINCLQDQVSNSAFLVEIFSVTGESKLKIVSAYNEEIDVSALSNGVYFVVISDSNNYKITKQLVKIN